MGTVGAYGRVSGEFDITTDARRGDVVAPFLFSFFFDAMIATTMSPHPNVGERMPYSLEGPLEGSRRKMRG